MINICSGTDVCHIRTVGMEECVMQSRINHIFRKLSVPAVIIAFMVIMICLTGCGSKASAASEASVQTTYTTYVVQRGDSLWSIADAHLGGSFSSHSDYMREVRRANALKGNDLYEGQLLAIPYQALTADNGVVAVRP